MEATVKMLVEEFLRRKHDNTHANRQTRTHTVRAKTRHRVF